MNCWVLQRTQSVDVFDALGMDVCFPRLDRILDVQRIAHSNDEASYN